MNDGILTQSQTPPAMPYGLMGLPFGVPTPSGGLHPEAIDWLNRVRANGGDASFSTLRAVSDFCRGVDGLGLRGLFYRLNLFCGRNLAAAMVPLYRSPAPSGRRYGFPVEANYNFVSSDYVETGVNAGILSSDGKYIITGLSVTEFFPVTSGAHMGFATTRQGLIFRDYMGTDYGNVLNGVNSYFIRQNSGLQVQVGANISSANTATHAPRRFTCSSTATVGNRMIVAGVAGTAFGSMTTAPSGFIAVFHKAASDTTAGSNFMPGGVFQMYSIGASLTSQQSLAIDTLLRSFNAALRRDRPSSDPAFDHVAHPEAREWIDNVYANGGTVSTTTATAVNDFCAAIDAAGIRDRFYRLNLFCGDSLSAALVPLYRGTSAAGSQLGNGTDTNSGFVSGDYSLAGGMNNSTGASTKFLSTGLAPNALPQLQTGHMSSAIMSYTSGSGFAIGVQQLNRFNSTFFVSNANSMSVGAANFTGDFGAAIASPIGRWLATRSSNTSGIGYRNAVQAISQTASQSTRLNGATTFGIFGRSISSDPAVASAVQGTSMAIRIGAYSIGDSLTAQQVTSFDTALTNFFTAIGRS